MVALVVEGRRLGQYVVGLVDKMPALNEGRAAKTAGEKHGGILLRAFGTDLVVEQRHSLGNVRRDDRRQREQATRKRFGGILGNEASARRGDHNGVDDHVGCVPCAQAIGDNFDNLGGRNHADFDCVGANIVKDGVNLRSDDIGGDILHSGDTERVLCGDGGDGRLGIQTVRRDGLDVGLNAGTTAGIGSCDGQDGRYLATIHVRSLVRLDSNGSSTCIIKLPGPAVCRSRAGGAIFTQMLANVHTSTIDGPRSRLAGDCFEKS